MCYIFRWICDRTWEGNYLVLGRGQSEDKNKNKTESWICKGVSEAHRQEKGFLQNQKDNNYFLFLLSGSANKRGGGGGGRGLTSINISAKKKWRHNYSTCLAFRSRGLVHLYLSKKHQQQKNQFFSPLSLSLAHAVGILYNVSRHRAAARREIKICILLFATNR